MRPVLDLVERLYPVPPEAPSDLRFKARFLGWATVGAVAVSLFDLVRHLAAGDTADALRTLVGLVFVPVTFGTYRVTRSMRAVANVLAAVMLVAFSLQVISSGSPALLVWFSTPVVLVVFLSGRQAALTWYLLTTGFVVALSWMMVVGVLPANDTRSIMTQSWSSVLAVVLLSGLVVTFDVSREASLRQAEEARRVAEEANREKSRFLANVSHEIRTPLNGVLGMTELLLTGELPAPLRDSLGIIHHSGVTLRALINDLLDLSRAEAGRLELALAAFDVARPVRAAVALYAAQASEKGLTLRAELAGAPDRLMVHGDGVRVSQVLNNLVGNAVKFTAHGEVVVRLEAAPAGAGRHTLRFSVRDTGPGLTPEEQARLFQPFAQLRAVHGLGGTGLGLAISRQLVELMGGRIGIRSEKGKGSEFYFELTLAEAHDVDDETSGPAVTPLAAFTGHVLVVDDNAINARVACGLLARLGLEVSEAHDGAEALARLARGGVDLVLMDVHMPGVDGLEATRRFRQQEPRGQRLPIIALTASALTSELDACREVGMDDCLTKPVQLKMLRRALAPFLPLRDAQHSPS